MTTAQRLFERMEEAQTAGNTDLARTLAQQITAISERDESVMADIGRGIAAAPLALAQGLTEFGAAALDSGLDTGYSRAVTQAFEDYRLSTGLVPGRTAGRVAEDVVSFGLGFIPFAGWLGRASTVARGGTVIPGRGRFLRSAESFGNSATGRALVGNRLRLAGTTALSAGVYEALVSPEGRMTMSDVFSVLPDELETEAEFNESGRSEGFRRLRNRLRFGIEGLAVGAAAEAVLPVVGAAARGVAQTPGIPQAARAIMEVKNRALDAITTNLSNMPWLRGRDVAERSMAFLRRNLTSTRGLPRDLAEELIGAGKFRTSLESTAALYVNEFDNTVREVLRFQSLPGRGRAGVQAAQDDLRRFLSGDFNSFLRSGRYKPEAAQRLTESARRMRNQIDGLSEDLIRELDEVPEAVLPLARRNEMVQELRNNMGRYLNRAYEVHVNPMRFADPRTYDTPVYRQSVDEVETYLRDTHPQLFMGAAPIVADSKEYARAVINQVVNQGVVNLDLALDDALRLMQQGLRAGEQTFEGGRVPLYRVAEGMLRPRKPIMEAAPSLREFMREITDPKATYFRTVSQMSELVANARMFRFMDENFQGNWIRRTQDFETLAEEGALRVVPQYRDIDIMRQQLELTPEGQLPALRQQIQTVERAFQNAMRDQMRNLTAGYVQLGDAAVGDVFGPYGAISGQYVRQELYDAMTMPARSNTVLGNLWGTVLQARGLTQIAATVYNPLTQVANAVGNVFFLGANGNLGRGLDFADSFRTTLGALDNLDNTAFMETMDRVARLGLTDENLILQEARRNIRGLVQPGGMVALPGALKEGAEALLNRVPGNTAFQTLYQASDTFGKVAAYMAEQSKYGTAFRRAGIDPDSLPDDVLGALRDAGLLVRTNTAQRRGSPFAPGRMPSRDDSALELMAADTVTSTMPTYSRVPELVQDIRRLPIGNFVAFPSEVIRTSSNILGRGMRELGFRLPDEVVQRIGPQAARTLEREIRTIGAQRLSSYVSLALTQPAAMRAAAMSMTDTTDAEMRALESQAPPWYRGHVLAPVANDHRGNIEYIDLSYLNPYDFVLQPARAMLQTYAQRGELGEADLNTARQAVWAGLKSFFEPFAGEAMLFERLRTVLPREYFGLGGRGTSGTPVYDPSDSFETQVGRSITHLFGGFIPAYMQYFAEERGGQFDPGRLTRAALELPNTQGRVVSPFEEAASTFTAFRLHDMNLRNTFYYSGVEYGQLRTNAQTIFNRTARSPVSTEEDIIAAFDRAQENRFRAQRQLYADIQAARTMGLTNQQIVVQLRQRANLGAAEVGQIMRGQFVPLTPSREVIAEIARDARAEDRERIVARLPVRELFDRARQARSLRLDGGGTEEQAAEPLAPNPWRNAPEDLAPEPGLVDNLGERLRAVFGGEPEAPAPVPAPAAGVPAGVTPPAPPSVAPAAPPQVLAPQPPATPPLSVSPSLLGDDPLSQARNAELAARLGR